MAHHQRHFERLEQRGLGCDAHDFVGTQTQSVHAGVELNGGWQMPTNRRAVGRPIAQLRLARQHGPEIEPGVVHFGAWQQAIENINRSTRLDRTRTAAFFEGCDEECVAAFIG